MRISNLRQIIYSRVGTFAVVLLIFVFATGCSIPEETISTDVSFPSSDGWRAHHEGALRKLSNSEVSVTVTFTNSISLERLLGVLEDAPLVVHSIDTNVYLSDGTTAHLYDIPISSPFSTDAVTSAITGFSALSLPPGSAQASSVLNAVSMPSTVSVVAVHGDGTATLIHSWWLTEDSVEIVTLDN